ncbi:hypothetical protein D9758_009062 [Tetrapyrgos nigripes]|uniref:Uncharacterized protein n=1 Tax=Tetrapyrgos nigripes TaxID=182062 RepID=A0A8H5LL10_9AGAR|nr:hypothetical protein D9758_009062 [Tetrapyrgos nigripes]
MTSHVVNHFRPHKTEAIVRIRQNAFFVLSIVLLTYLLPVPSIAYALASVLSGNGGSRGSVEEKIICVFEILCITIPSYNILESLYAIKYPRAPPPLPPSHPQSPFNVNAKAKALVSPSPVGMKKKGSSILGSSTSNPTSPKIFTYSPGSSIALSQSQSQSQSRGNPLSPLSKGQYPPSPLSTPSRILHYSMPPGSTMSNISTTTNPTSVNRDVKTEMVTGGLDGSMSALPPTPSPIVSAYKSRRGGGDVVGRE